MVNELEEAGVSVGQVCFVLTWAVLMDSREDPAGQKKELRASVGSLNHLILSG